MADMSVSLDRVNPYSVPQNDARTTASQNQPPVDQTQNVDTGASGVNPVVPENQSKLLDTYG
ncbi:MAG: hypothetical protein KDK41_13770 [Leptospiraceae bacterium]|nr:hypothetical protein [Leptospiraceae bacterium]MCB1201710.1 hypothetical protein [Leptospiraceae bacterium]